MIRIKHSLFLGLTAALIACGGDDEEAKEEGCSVEKQTGCDAGKVCEEVVNGTPACFAPVSVQGRVFDSSTNAAIEGAHVVARDANDAAVSEVAETDASGNYSLRVPTPRNAEGVPQTKDVTLRADAAGYVTYPTAPRVALPLDLSKAVSDVLKTPATDIGLLPMPNSTGLGSVSGKVLGDNPGGTLVVVSGSAGSATGVADKNGAYTVFNVAAGDHQVRGYKALTNLAAVTASVSAGQQTTGVDLAVAGAANAVVSGKISLANPGDGTATSVILVVSDTFVESAARGEAPPGLRVTNISGDFSISGVPNGTYKVLAAFENDFLVRDPDVSIGGTDIVEITVAGASVAIPENFKVTGALDVVSPDAEQEVTGTPTFAWKDDRSEKSYVVQLFDAYGNEVWKTTIEGQSGDKDVTVSYDGTALTAGQIYQFRATSLDIEGVPISRTEDLRGVFRYR